MSEASLIRTAALRALSRREYSVWELKQKLIDKGFEAQLTEQTVDDLKENNLVNDQRYAHEYLRVHAMRGKGPLKIAHELTRRRIDQQIITELVDENSEIWNERINSVVHKKYNERPILDVKDWASRNRFLRSRGFTTPQIASVIGSFDSVKREF